MGKMTIGQMIAQLGSGMLISTQIFVITLLFSLPLGLVVAFGRMSKNRVISMIVKFYISMKEKIEAAINSTREGKEMSLIQYINVASAEYTPEDNENNVNIMLKSILNQLSELKEGENLFDYAKRNYFRSVRYVVNKHEGLTKKLLFERITNMRNIFHKKISYTNKKEYLIIEVVDIETQEIEDQIKQFINEYIGIIKE